MYQNLLFAVKNRILDEVVEAFNQHPAFSKKVQIYHKFPYEKRVQYGVVLRDTSSSQIRLSADNYLAELQSHVRLGRVPNYPGTGIEWARENSAYVTDRIVDEDVSFQLNITQRLFYTQHAIVSGLGNTTYADNPCQVRVTVDGQEVIPEYVNGEKKIVMLRSAPPSGGSIVKISYYHRVLAQPGYYVIDFNEDNQFIVGALFTIDSILLIEKTTGLETTITIPNTDIYPGSEDLYLKSRNGGIPILLIKDTDYSIDYTTGVVTFLNPLQANFQFFGDYKYQAGYSVGPFTFTAYQEIHNAIPGVVLSLGRRSQKGDRQIVIVSKKREAQARVYGGHWEMSLGLAVIAKDPIQMAEMTDHLVNYLWGKRKNVLEYEGITMTGVTPTGESEEVHIDTTGDMYYESMVDIALMSEWQEFIPYFFEIKQVLVDLHMTDFTEFKNYYVTLDNKIIIPGAQADMRHVIKYPTVGYERVS